MLKLGRVTKFKVLFLALVFVFNFSLLEFSAAILEKGLLFHSWKILGTISTYITVFFACFSENLAILSFKIAIAAEKSLVQEIFFFSAQSLGGHFLFSFFSYIAGTKSR